MADLTGLTEYIISYSKDGFEQPITEEGLNQFRIELKALQKEAAAGTDYDDRVKAVAAHCMLSFVSRPDTKTLNFHRVWTDQKEAEAFFTANESSVFEYFRKKGWNVSWTSRPLDTNTLRGSEITLI